MTKSERKVRDATWATWYVEHQLPIREIARRASTPTSTVAPKTVAQALRRVGVTLRARGGKNNPWGCKGHPERRPPLVHA